MLLIAFPLSKFKLDENYQDAYLINVQTSLAIISASMPMGSKHQFGLPLFSGTKYEHKKNDNKNACKATTKGAKSHFCLSEASVISNYLVDILFWKVLSPFTMVT
ncbi:MAG TPA: hypothetical protein VF691_16235 [Cytophagaceae bacterium]|jgi:hypothetical protein